MDASLIISLLVAVVAIVPGVWALVNQANKDKSQQKLDAQNMAQTAALGIIQPLREEVTRLQGRVAELEADLQDKSTRISELEQALFEKDSTIRKMQYSIDGFKLRLDGLDTNGKSTKKEETQENTNKEG